MKRPVFWVAGFLVVGILTQTLFHDLTSLTFMSILVLVGLFLCLILNKVYKYKLVFLFIVFFFIGFTRAGSSMESAITEPKYLSFSGVVVETRYTSSFNQSVIIKGEDKNIVAFLRPFHSTASLGQQITVFGELRPLQKSRNPGEYNQFFHLRPQKVDSVMWPETVILGETKTSLTVLLRSFRDRLAAVYDEILPQREAAVIKSMVLGDRADMDRDLADAYRTMGIFHILSISGLHVTILMLAANKFFGLFLKEKKAGIVVLVFMILYCFMTGAAVSTVRAVTMGTILIFGKIIGRDYDLLTAVSWAFVVLLIYEPLYLFTIGFQLSFGAVYGIAILTEPVDRMLIKIGLFIKSKLGVVFREKGAFRKNLAFGIAAVVSTYPILAFHFYEIPLYSVVGNLIIAPTTTVILVLGLVVGLIGVVWLPAAYVLSGGVYFILRFYELMSGIFTDLPFAMIHTGGGNLVVTLFGFIVLGSFSYMMFGFEKSFKRRRVMFIISVFILVGAVYLWQNPRGLYITLLDTPGNYIVLRHRNDVLVIAQETGGEDALVRYLNRQNVRNVSLLFLNPPMPQSARNLEILAPFVKTTYLPDFVTGTTESLMMDAVEPLHGSEIILLSSGDMRQSGNKRLTVNKHPEGFFNAFVSFGSNSVFIYSSKFAGQINYEELSRLSHLVLWGNYVIPFDYVYFSTENYGAISIHLTNLRFSFNHLLSHIIPPGKHTTRQHYSTLGNKSNFSDSYSSIFQNHF